MADDLGERFEELVHHVLAPLVLGGSLEPVRPFGGPLGLRIGVGREMADLDLRSQLDVARVRRARLLAPVDTLPPLDEADWAVLAALNDILLVTHHELGGVFTRGRYARLLGNLRWLCERIPTPRDVLGVLSRHATFGRALEIVRVDTRVSWWTGSARFRGQPPPARLLAWREIRRVHVEHTQVPISDMPVGAEGLSLDEFLEILTLWLSRSPLTDLATATRRAPSFLWSASTLSLIATPPGRSLARRALTRGDPKLAVVALMRAAKEIPTSLEGLRRLAEDFAGELAEVAKPEADKTARR